MNLSRKKKINNTKNNTKKKREKLCTNYKNTYNTFEDKLEEVFKKNKVSIISTSYNLEKHIVSELKKAVNTKNIKPNQDFYSYINDRWIKDYELTEKQKYIVQIDDFRLIQDKVYNELIEIINNYISDPATKNSKKAKCIKNAYTSFLKYNTINQAREMSKKVLDYINDLFNDKNNVWQNLALINSNEIISYGAPFVWTLNPDDKNPTIYKCFLEPPQLSLIDINIYFDDPEDNKETIKYKKKYRNIFFKYLKNLFRIAFGNNHGFNVKDIFNVEFEILNAMACDLIKSKNEDNYNVVSKEEAIKNFGFNWTEFCKALGFKKIPDSFITSNINYLLCGTKLLLEKWNTPQWKTYWIYLYIRQQCRWTLEGSQNYFEFEGNFVRGQEIDIDKNILPVFPMGFLFNTFLTNQYVSKYNNIQSINYVKTMAEDLKIVFIRILKRNTWLQPTTKKKAIKKIESLKFIVGSHELLNDDPLLNYTYDDPWGNLLKYNKYRHDKAIGLVDKKITDLPVVDWTQSPPKFVGTQSYIVNAFYTPSRNDIYIPLGYIQSPFVDLEERGLEYNLSRIGFTIAHEMSHALDDLGNQYDENGKLNSWFTEKDIKIFDKIKKDIIKQYEVYASYDGIDLDAEPSIGEDLADISGLEICQEYLRDFQLKNQYILPIQRLSFETFYIYFAINSRQKISKKAILAQLKTNPHPLEKYRCNVPLSRTRVFRAIYNVIKGDKMWWYNTNNVWTD